MWPCLKITDTQPFHIFFSPATMNHLSCTDVWSVTWNIWRRTTEAFLIGSAAYSRKDTSAAQLLIGQFTEPPPLSPSTLVDSHCCININPAEWRWGWLHCFNRVPAMSLLLKLANRFPVCGRYVAGMLAKPVPANSPSTLADMPGPSAVRFAYDLFFNKGISRLHELQVRTTCSNIIKNTSRLNGSSMMFGCCLTCWVFPAHFTFISEFQYFASNILLSLFN